MLLAVIDLIAFLCLAVQFVIAGYFLYLVYWSFELPPADAVLPALPDELPRVLVPLFAGEADLVQGSRWLPGGATPGIPADRRWLTRLYPLLFRLASGHAVTDGTNGLRAFRLALLDDPRIRLEQSWLDRYELEPYLLYQAMRAGYRVREAPVTVRYHGRGTTKMRFKDGWRILRPLVYLRLGLRH